MLKFPLCKNMQKVFLHKNCNVHLIYAHMLNTCGKTERTFLGMFELFFVATSCVSCEAEEK